MGILYQYKYHLHFVLAVWMANPFLNAPRPCRAVYSSSVTGNGVGMEVDNDYEFEVGSTIWINQDREMQCDPNTSICRIVDDARTQLFAYCQSHADGDHWTAMHKVGRAVDWIDDPRRRIRPLD